jgi:hypothetical protein
LKSALDCILQATNRTTTVTNEKAEIVDKDTPFKFVGEQFRAMGEAAWLPARMRGVVSARVEHWGHSGKRVRKFECSALSLAQTGECRAEGDGIAGIEQL